MMMVVIEYGVAKMRSAVQAMGVWVLLSLGPGLAFAQSEPADLLEAGRGAERSADFAAAFEAYERASEEGRGTRAGRRAEQRADYLRARRDPDGSFTSLAALEEMRRAQPTDDRLVAFERATRDMPPGSVRDDALFLLAESWFRRRDNPARALPIYEALAASPTLSSARRRTVGVARAEANAALGQTSAALRTLSDEGLSETFEGRALEAEVARARMRMAAAVIFCLALVSLLALAWPIRHPRQTFGRLSWKQAAAAAYVLTVPAIIAELYEPATGDAFLYYAAVALPLLALAVLAAPSLSPARVTRRRRALFVTSLVVAQLAGAWLALDLADGLGGFGFP